MSYSEREKRERKTAHDTLKRLVDEDFRQILLEMPKVAKIYEDVSLEDATPGVRQAVYAAIGGTSKPMAAWKKHNLEVDALLKKGLAKLAD